MCVVFGTVVIPNPHFHAASQRYFCPDASQVFAFGVGVVWLSDSSH